VATAASGNSILVTPQGFSSAADRTGAARRPKGNTLTLRHSGRWRARLDTPDIFGRLLFW
jgi:hypothetical protein